MKNTPDNCPLHEPVRVDGELRCKRCGLVLARAVDEKGQSNWKKVK